jgi:hypothetical protein
VNPKRDDSTTNPTDPIVQIGGSSYRASVLEAEIVKARQQANRFRVGNVLGLGWLLVLVIASLPEMADDNFRAVRLDGDIRGAIQILNKNAAWVPLRFEARI